MNVDNILGKKFFLNIESEVKRMAAFDGNSGFDPLSFVTQHNGKKTSSTLQSNTFKISKSQKENVIVSY